MVLLDVDPLSDADLCWDARDLSALDGETYDAVYCANTLEHLYQHELAGVLTGMRHVMRADAILYLVVPDTYAVMETVVSRRMDVITDALYESDGLGAITPHDVIFGYGHALASGHLTFAHKSGFTVTSITTAIRHAGFTHLSASTSQWSITVTARKENGK
jgi:hypothetical protein